MRDKNVVLIEGINKIIEGLTDVKSALVFSDVTNMMEKTQDVVSDLVIPSVDTEVKVETPEVVEVPKVEKIVEEIVEEAVEEVEETEEEPVETSREEELMALSINEIRSLAKSYGLSGGGSKATLVANILAHETTEEGEEATEEEVVISEEVKEAIKKLEEEATEEVVEAEFEEVEEDVESEEDVDLEEWRETLMTDLELEDVKELATAMGIKFTSKSTQEVIVNKLLAKFDILQDTLTELGYMDSEEDGEVVEDEVEETAKETPTFSEEDVKEYKEFLIEEFDLEGLKEVAEYANVEVPAKITKTKLIDLLISDMESLHESLDELGCFQSEDEEESSEEEVVEDTTVEDTVEDTEDEEETEEEDYATTLGLREMTQEELADILADHGLSTKGLKTALIDRIVLAVKNGLIDVESDDAPMILSNKQLDELKKKIFNIEVEAFENKTLAPKQIQSFLKKYYVEQKEYHNYKKMGLTNQDALGLYVKAKQSLLDDYGTRTELQEAYLKDGSYHCCGRELVRYDETTSFCPNCGSRYEVK